VDLYNYTAAALLAMQSAVLATAIPSACLSVTWWYCTQTNQIKSNQIYLLKTSHLRVAIDKTVDEQGRQGSKEHLQ